MSHPDPELPHSGLLLKGRLSRLARRLIALSALCLTVGAGSSVGVVPAHAVSPDVVISQIYGGGGNSGATYTHDFIELVNRGPVTVDLTGWSVQYASASGSTWQVTVLSGSIAPGQRYLVQQAAGAAGTTPLPTPDVSGTISMSASSGKVALVTRTTALTCGTTCASAADVRDFVGYGAANDAEGSPAPLLSNTTAAHRLDAADTDNNAADFVTGPPSPRGADEAPPPRTARIHDIQGAAHLSPLTGQRVHEVPGVVTALRDNGFWMQDPEPDHDPATSEGLFVFTRQAPTVAPGDVVAVSGLVTEYRPGGEAENLTLTQISDPIVRITGERVSLPEPTLLGPGGLTAPPAIRVDAPGDVEAAGVDFDPSLNALDFYESLEGMLLRVADAVVVGATNDYGELTVLPGGEGDPRTTRGGIRYLYSDPNTERVILDDTLAAMPAADVGDRLPGPIDGVLDYSFGNFKFYPLRTPSVIATGPEPERTRPQRPGELAIATYNVENLDPGDPEEHFARLASDLVTRLASPDIVALEEVQDNSGPTDDGTVAANRTYRMLIDAIVAAGGPRYDYRQIDPVDQADGGQPGGNIRVGFLFRTDRGLRFVDRPGGDATSATDVVRRGGRAALTLSPGRVDPTNEAWTDSRKPLVGEFRFRGETIFVIANHFTSKGGDQPLFGRFQPPARDSEIQRHAQAAAVRAFVDRIFAVDPHANVVVLGDLNDFEFSRTVDILVGANHSLVDLPRTLPEPERYTYVFDGNSQVLDHILISRSLARCGWSYDVVHLNAEYTDQASDHDPQLVRLRLR